MYPRSMSRKKDSLIPAASVSRAILAVTWCLLAAVILAGVAGTYVWFRRHGDPRTLYSLMPSLVVGFLVISIFTVANIALRWTRWHYLVRRIGVRLPTRESLAVYLAALPAMLTPFSVGELLRVVLLGKRNPRLRLDAVGIWIVERATDVFVLAAIAGCAGGRAAWAAGGLALWLFTMLLVRAIYRQRHFGSGLNITSIPVLLGLSIASWLLPGVALWFGALLVGETISMPVAMDAFAHSTLLGGSAGIPLGTGLTGSTLIRSLVDHQLGATATVGLVFAFRMGTAWLAVIIGCIAWGVFHVRLMALLRGAAEQNHFDDIADDYGKLLPAHVRQRLLGRKVGFMLEGLDPSASQRGLDLGCGPGWYLVEMAKHGFIMSGVDQSEGQVASARRHASKSGVEAKIETTDGTHLPFPSDYFDFAYAINVMHHLTDSHARNALWLELVRVLKPGGVFIMHEINIANPLFRFYMGYVFPLIRAIDEGTEVWIHPGRLPDVARARWETSIDYFTFLPDFMPAGRLFRLLAVLERKLEHSRLRHWSAHYAARLVKSDQRG